ncbi:pilus assembly protein [Arthrobacter sp. S1_S22]|nr:pilus assembly protein [Arthrobacter sp. S1_S22]
MHQGDPLKRSASRAKDRSRGAVAVEFALVAPLLLALLAGIVEFAHAFNLQISVTQAAREAARTMAITNSQADAETAAANGAPGLATDTFAYTFTPAACVADGTVNVEVSYTTDTLTGIFGSGVTLVGVGAMRCGG